MLYQMLYLPADKLWLAHELPPQRALGRFRASQRNVQIRDGGWLPLKAQLSRAFFTSKISQRRLP
jgi:hypothetical protein